MKERVTLTIEANLLRQIDSTVNGSTIRNRSHAVEMLLREAMKGEMPAHGVILAGGDEQAVERVLTTEQGKPLIKHNIDLLLGAGLEHIIIVTKNPEKIRGAVGEIKDAEIQYVTETHPLGTAGALHLAKPYLEGPFLVSNADDIKDVNIKEMFDFHRHAGGLATMALTTTNNPAEYGVALLNGNRIVTFVEKPDPDKAPSNLISAGLYIMEVGVLDLIPSGYARMEYDIFPKLTKEDELYGYHFSGVYEHTA